MKTKHTGNEMSAKKQPSKPSKPEISISASQETIDLFKSLVKDKKGMNYGDLFEAMMDKFTDKLSEKPEIDFVFVGKEKDEKEPILKEIFDLEEGDNLLISEKELLEKACELSGKSLAEITSKGRIMAAKQEIGFHIQKQLRKGKRGSADDRLKATLKYLVENSLPLSINRIVQGDGSSKPTYRPTVERFVDDNNLRAEVGSSMLDPDAVDSYLGGLNE